MKNQFRDWTKLDKNAFRYHLNQYKNPKESTKAFEIFARPVFKKSQRILDLACGAGAVSNYLAKKYPKSKIIGIDKNKCLIKIAKKTNKYNNLSFTCGNLYFLPKKYLRYQTIISLQTLSWLPDLKKALAAILKKTQPQWFAFSSLFYPGNISAHIRIFEHKRNKQSFYNTYSIPDLKKIIKKFGYKIKKLQPYHIKKILRKPRSKDVMQTYTLRSGKKNIQISGPIILNWFFVLIEKNKKQKN